MDKPQTELCVRLLGPEDAERLCAADPDTFDAPVQPALAAAFLHQQDTHAIAAALHGERVVGMATGVFYLHPDKPLSLFIAEVGVADAYLRQGLGRRLVDCLLTEGRRRGCAEAWVATEVDNAPARALYAAAGGELAPERFVVYAWPLGEDSESDESAPR